MKKENIIIITIVTILISISVLFAYQRINNSIQLHQNIKDKPIESEYGQEDLKGSILIYIQDSCPDCIIIKDDIINVQKEYGKKYNIQIIDAKSKSGQKLLQKYHVSWVPTAYYVPYNEKDFPEEDRKVRLDNNGEFDHKAFETLLNYAKEKL